MTEVDDGDDPFGNERQGKVSVFLIWSRMMIDVIRPFILDIMSLTYIFFDREKV